MSCHIVSKVHLTLMWCKRWQFVMTHHIGLRHIAAHRGYAISAILAIMPLVMAPSWEVPSLICTILDQERPFFAQHIPPLIEEPFGGL